MKTIVYYIIYQTTNLINGKIYIGKHKTSNLEDGYLGSGKHLNWAINKYGIDNFKREILFFCESEDEMNTKEREIVNEDFVARKDTYNMKVGGEGGWDYVNSGEVYTKEKRSASIAKKWKDPKYRDALVKINQSRMNKLTPEDRLKMSERSTKSLTEYYKHHPGTMLGKHHSEETKKKIGEKNSIANKGENNNNYNHRWWKDPNDKTKSLSIKEGDPIPEGWVPGHWHCEILRKEKIKICPYCGFEKGKCEHLEVCSRPQMIAGWKKIFHPNENVYGSKSFYDVWFSDLNLVKQWYVDEHLSILDIAKKLNYQKKSLSSLYSCISSMLKMNGIEMRSFKEAGKNSYSKRLG